MIECIDLRAEYGDQYRVVSEETAVKGGKWDPWLAQIRCRYGHIYLHGGDELGVAVDSGRVIIAGRIRQLPFVEVIQDGDNGEVNAVFHHRDLDKVLEIMRPYRVWHCSEEERERRRNLLARARESQGCSDTGTLEADLGPSGALQVKSIDFAPDAILVDSGAV